jgi:hypothetical protein
MSKYGVNPSEADKWLCANCQTTLVSKPVRIEYLGSAFPVDLPTCPNCGQVFISEELVIGKMAEVEKTLEDK